MNDSRDDAGRLFELAMNSLAGEVTPPPAMLDKAEKRLFARIARTETAEPWELYLKRDLPVSLDRVAPKNVRPVYAFPALFLNFAAAHRRLASAAALTLIAVLAAIFGFVKYGPQNRPVVTAVGLIEGGAFTGMPVFVREHDRVAAGGDQRLTLANARGTVSIDRGAGITMVSLRKGNVAYAVDFAAGGGSALFSVTKRKHRETFTVAAPDYSIEVTGTLFSVRPGPGGKTETCVIEGAVMIRQPRSGATPLGAGQAFIFDTSSNRWTVAPTGGCASEAPSPRFTFVDSALISLRPLTVASSPAGATVLVDCAPRGSAPLRMLVAPGLRHIVVRLSGYATIDTVMAIGGSAESSLEAVLTFDKQAEEPVGAHRAVKPHSRSRTASRRCDVLFTDASALEVRDWKQARTLYQKALDDTLSSPFEREFASFSLARLYADHDTNTVAIRAALKAYLTRFPSGSFVAESYLRLGDLEYRDDPAAAFESYSAYLHRFPATHNVAAVEYKAALICLQRKKYDEAARLLSDALVNARNYPPDQIEAMRSVLRQAQAAGNR
jgi:hypothetical protein